MTKDLPPRKPLRQRVAEHKRGIKEIRLVSARKKRLLRLVRLFLTASQYSGLLLLLLSLGGLVSNNYQIDNVNLIVIYCAMFLFGRFGITILNSMATFR